MKLTVKDDGFNGAPHGTFKAVQKGNAIILSGRAAGIPSYPSSLKIELPGGKASNTTIDFTTTLKQAAERIAGRIKDQTGFHAVAKAAGPGAWEVVVSRP